MKTLVCIVLCVLCCMHSVAQNEVKELRDDNSTVYLQPDKLPVFPSGMEGLMAFLRENVRYPDLAHKQGVQGRVIVQFVVNRDGSISDAKVIKSVHEYLDKEALRVVNAMPYWKPGVKDGEKVRVQFTLPITFRLQKDNAVKNQNFSLNALVNTSWFV